MTDKKPPQTADDVLRALNEFLLGEEPDFRSMPADKLDEYLKAAGVDPSPAIQAIRKEITKIKGAQALQAARQKREAQAEKKTKRTPREDLLQMGREAMLALLQQLMGNQEAAVYLRKFETLDDEDLRSLIQDREELEDDDDAER